MNAIHLCPIQFCSQQWLCWYNMQPFPKQCLLKISNDLYAPVFISVARGSYFVQNQNELICNTKLLLCIKLWVRTSKILFYYYLHTLFSNQCFFLLLYLYCNSKSPIKISFIAIYKLFNSLIPSYLKKNKAKLLYFTLVYLPQISPWQNITFSLMRKSSLVSGMTDCSASAKT